MNKQEIFDYLTKTGKAVKLENIRTPYKGCFPGCYSNCSDDCSECTSAIEFMNEEEKK